MHCKTILIIFWLICLDTESKFISPECQCHLFRSSGRSNGTFKSPSLSLTALTSMNCLIYSFLAQSDELVHIRFVEFNIPRAKPTSKRCSAYVRVYNQIQTASLNEADPYDAELCGKLVELPQDQFFSSFERLILVVKLHPDAEVVDYGFRGHYWFESKNQYKTTGLAIPGTKCDWFAMSESSQTGGTVEPGRSGRIHSPNYPSNYPAGLHCRFQFIGQLKERVILTLYDVELAEKKEKCKHRLEGDYILLQEATSIAQSTASLMSSRNRTISLQPTKYIWHYCGKLTQAEIVSDGPNLLLTFVSNKDGEQRRGFAASYRFVHRNQVRPTTFATSEVPLHVPLQEYQIMDSTFGALPEWPLFRSVEKFSWFDGVQTGMLQSPNFPEVYPRNAEYSYVILGRPQGQIHLSIRVFRLDVQHSSTCARHTGDRLELRIGPELNERVWGILCGVSLPEQLRNLVIRHDRLRLRFVSDNVTNPVELGFQLVYDFKLPEFPIPHYSPTTENQSYPRLENTTMNKPDSHAKDFTHNNCTILIESNGSTSKGYIRLLDSIVAQPLEDYMIGDETPRVERCRWILQGEAHQRIQLKVVHFKDQALQTLEKTPEDFAVQNDEFQSRKDNSFEDYPRQPSISSHYVGYRIPRIKCMKPYQVEILTFQRSSKTASYVDLLDQAKPLVDQTSTYFTTGTHNDTSGRFFMQISDRLQLCLGSRIKSDTFAKGYMSASIPRVELILKTAVFNQSKTNGQSIVPHPASSMEMKPNVAIEYNFVTDYGVSSQFGRQNLPGCDFIFRSSDSTYGNFTSPNYPGLYPADLTCHYTFVGKVNEVIDLRFLEFDVDSSTVTCSAEGGGDYVELEPCTQYNFLKLTRKRYCQKPLKNRSIAIRWNNPCLNLRFVSDHQIVRNGFLGVYQFHKSGANRSQYYFTWLFWLFVTHQLVT